MKAALEVPLLLPCCLFRRALTLRRMSSSSAAAQSGKKDRAFVSSELPKTARIVEVGLRDGLQNEKKLVTLQNKIKLLNILEKSGHSTIELGALLNSYTCYSIIIYVFIYYYIVW